MTLILTFAAFFVAVSFCLGTYFRVAEYDVLASDKVWERIVPASQAIVENEDVPDDLAGMVTAFAMLTGCGCFVNAVLTDSLKTRLGFSSVRDADDDEVQGQIASLTPEVRHMLANLLQDLLIFDSLHAPILGRLCRVLNRESLSRDRYRVKAVDADTEREVIFRITAAAGSTIERKSERKPELALV